MMRLDSVSSSAPQQGQDPRCLLVVGWYPQNREMRDTRLVHLFMHNARLRSIIRHASKTCVNARVSSFQVEAAEYNYVFRTEHCTSIQYPALRTEIIALATFCERDDMPAAFLEQCNSPWSSCTALTATTNSPPLRILNEFEQ